MAVVNSLGEYSALILGGVESDSGISVTHLANGDYTLKVEALELSTNASLASDSLKITVGTSNMVATRFSPKAADGYPHLENAIQFAKDNNLKALLESFPAYWEKDKPEKVLYEYCKMWRANDLSEYLAAANFHVIIYNISESCDDVIGLRYDEAGHDETSLYLGASLRHELKSSVLYASAFYKRRICDSGIDLKARFLPGGAPFVITGEELPKDALAISAGYRCGLTQDGNRSLAVEYEGEFGGGFQKNQFNLRYEMKL